MDTVFNLFLIISLLDIKTLNRKKSNEEYTYHEFYGVVKTVILLALIV